MTIEEFGQVFFQAGLYDRKEKIMVDKDLLRKPFDPSQIQSRQGSGKTNFDYIAGYDVTERLIEATDNEYSWEVTRLEFVSDGKSGFWLCEGKLTIPPLGTKSGVGTHQAIDHESPKAAETDAMKRAAVRFGVGLHLYREKPGKARPQGTVAPAAGNGHGPAINPGPDACSECFAPAGKPHTPKCSRRHQASAKAMEYEPT